MSQWILWSIPGTSFVVFVSSYTSVHPSLDNTLSGELLATVILSQRRMKVTLGRKQQQGHKHEAATPKVPNRLTAAELHSLAHPRSLGGEWRWNSFICGQSHHLLVRLNSARTCVLSSMCCGEWDSREFLLALCVPTPCNKRRLRDRNSARSTRDLIKWCHQVGPLVRQSH